MAETQRWFGYRRVAIWYSRRSSVLWKHLRNGRTQFLAYGSVHLRSRAICCASISGRGVFSGTASEIARITSTNSG